jgi:hypothetical protein
MFERFEMPTSRVRHFPLKSPSDLSIDEGCQLLPEADALPLPTIPIRTKSDRGAQAETSFVLR